MSFDFPRKVVLITGAGSGIGAACAFKFAKSGTLLSLTGRNEQNLQSVAEKCENLSATSSKPFIIIGDLTYPKDAEKIVAATIDHYARLDILINNAGILIRGTTTCLSLEDYDKQMNINVRSVFNLTKLSIPHLVKTKGNIVNVSSLSGLRTVMGQSAYCLSKAAIDQFTRVTSLELAPQQVRVNAVNPGVINTEILTRGGMSNEDYQKLLKRCEASYPLQRHGEVEEVASVIAFLASDSASFITGATIPVDGGMHMKCPR